MNIFDWIIIGLLVLWGVGAIIYYRRHSGAGCGSCGSCKGCPHAGNCSKRQKED